MDSFESLLFGAMFNNYATAEKAGHTEVDGYTIDTCDTCDCGFETAIWYKSNPMVIVERYPDKASAEAGHNKWVEVCELNSPIMVWSVQTDSYEPLM